MNDAVYKFKRYEDASLSYTGIDRHEGENRGGWDTVLSDADYNKMFTLQQASMEAPASAPDDLPTKPYFTPDEDEPKPTRRKAHRLPAEQQLYAPPSFQYPRQLYTTPGGFECWHWSCKAELWSEQLAAQPKPPVKVDVSKIKVGVKVKHKAFGVGTVTAIQPDMVTVRFGSVEKKFLLPAAIVQGYLTLIEE